MVMCEVTVKITLAYCFKFTSENGARNSDTLAC